MVSKACVVGIYQRKLEELARLPDMELWLVVPPCWRQGQNMLMLERAHTRGYHMQVLPMAFNGHFHLHFYLGLGKLVGDVRPDVVHIDEEPYNLATALTMWLAQRTAARTLFFTWQNLWRRYPLPFSLFERYNLQHADGAIAGNAEAREILCRKGYRGPVFVLPQFGIDPEMTEQRQRGPDDEFTMGYFGRMVEEKGVHLLLQAAARLDGLWRLRLIGDGAYLPRLKALCAQLDLEDRVVFHGWRSAGEMARCYSGLDVLVLPSITRPNWKEQFGRVLVEAMASKVPVVGSSSGEIPNVIGDAGLVFPEGDVSSLCDALSRLRADRALCDELGRRGRARVLQHYTQHRIAAATYEVYREILSQPSGAHQRPTGLPGLGTGL